MILQIYPPQRILEESLWLRRQGWRIISAESVSAAPAIRACTELAGSSVRGYSGVVWAGSPLATLDRRRISLFPLGRGKPQPSPPGSAQKVVPRSIQRLQRDAWSARVVALHAAPQPLPGALHQLAPLCHWWKSIWVTHYDVRMSSLISGVDAMHGLRDRAVACCVGGEEWGPLAPRPDRDSDKMLGWCVHSPGADKTMGPKWGFGGAPGARLQRSHTLWSAWMRFRSTKEGCCMAATLSPLWIS